MQLLWKATRTVIALALGAVPLVAHAQVTEYTNAAAFAAATNGLTTLGFEGIAPANGFVNYGTPGSLALSGVTFTTNSSTALFVIDDGFSSGYHIDGRGVLSAQTAIGNFISLTAALPAYTTAVGTDIAALDVSTIFQVTLSTGDSFLFSIPGSQSTPAFAFVGFTTATGKISSITFDAAVAASNATFTNFDDFRYGGANPVPEASTTVSLGLLLALGMGGVVVVARKGKVAP